MSKKVSVSKNKKILNFANEIIVEHTDGSFFTKMAPEPEGPPPGPAPAVNGTNMTERFFDKFSRFS